MEERIEEARRRCEAVVERIHNLPLSKITVSTKNTLLRLSHSEHSFLSRLSLSPHLHPLSCNIGYIEAIVQILQQPYVTKVSRVCKSIPLPLTDSYGKLSEERVETVHIDIICCYNNDPAWFIVSDRNPKYIIWDSSERNKGLKIRIEQIIASAKSSEALQPAFIALFFANGLDIAIIEKLEKDFGFTEFKLEFSEFDFAFADASEGEWVNVLGKSYQRACALMLKIDQYVKPCQSIKDVTSSSCSNCSAELPEIYSELSLDASFYTLILEMKEWPSDVLNLQPDRRDLSGDDVINFDTTALIAIISGISNGGAKKLLESLENDLVPRFKSNTTFVISQAKSEIESPIHIELRCVLSAKKGIVCRTVHSEFMDIVSMCGGPYEQMRADQLMKLLMIVPDFPSPRMMCLPTTRKLALKNKVAFGTGDYWGAPTLTANMGFVRAISQTGMPLFTIEHRPRALIGD